MQDSFSIPRSRDISYKDSRHRRDCVPAKDTTLLDHSWATSHRGCFRLGWENFSSLMAKLENNTCDRNTDRLDHSIITAGIAIMERKQTVQGQRIVIVLSRKYQALNTLGNHDLQAAPS